MEKTYRELLLSTGIRPKILIADDHGKVGSVVGELFKSDCDILMVTGGEEVIAQCMASLPDMVLLDVLVTGIDGYEVCRRLKANASTRHIPVIFISSQRAEIEEELSFEVGAVDYITKPFNKTILWARVRNQLILKLQANQLRSSELFTRTMTENIPGLFAYWNQDMRCLFSNRSYLEFLGKTPAQMAGISIKDALGEALFAKNEPMIRAALRGEPQRFERTLTKVDSSLAFTWTQYVPDVQEGKVNGFFVLVSDVTDLKRAELALEASEQFARSTIDTVPETICVLDKTGVIIAVNQAWRDFYDANYDDAQSINYAIGTNYLQVCESAIGANAAEAPQMAQGLAAVLAGERDLFSIEYPCDSPTEKRFFFARVKRFLGDTGHVLVAHGNVTERKMIELELARMAHTDVLTGLNNRRHFIELSETELSRTARHGGALSLLMLDIDHFKRVNDSHGHQVGDTVIQMLAAVCHEQLRELDVIGRLGGEEFAVTMPNTDHAQAMQVAERLRQAIEAASVPLPRGLPLRVTASIGVTTLPDNRTNLDTLLDQADQSLYRAKEQGRNRVSSFLSQT